MPGDAEALVEAASRAVLKDGQGLEVLDPAIADACDALEAERCISIALECLQQVCRSMTLASFSSSVDAYLLITPAQHRERTASSENDWTKLRESIC